MKNEFGTFCNKCGMSCLGCIGNENGLIEVETSGAYDSTHLEDGDVYKFSLCEKCLLELINSFKLNALSGNFLFPDSNNLFDRHQYIDSGIKLWEDYSQEEKENLVSSLKASSIEYFDNVPKEVLIVELYNAEHKENTTEYDLKYLEKIKKALTKRK